MDMSFHRNSALFRPHAAQAGRLPASGLPQRGRMVDGQEALRALSHVELMALVSTRINQERMRHWHSEAQLERGGARPAEARLALFAGSAALRPAWASAAIGAFCTKMEASRAAAHAKSALSDKNEHPVYLGGSNNRKGTGVKPGYRGAPALTPPTTFSI